MDDFDKRVYFSESFEKNLAKEYRRMYLALFHDKNIGKLSKRERQGVYRVFPAMFCSAILFTVFDMKSFRQRRKNR